jgi:hypothetical protein
MSVEVQVHLAKYTLFRVFYRVLSETDVSILLWTQNYATFSCIS